MSEEYCQASDPWCHRQRHHLRKKSDKPIDDPLRVEIFQSKENLGCIKLSLAKRKLLPLDM